MGARGYLLFACGQLGIMTLARFFFQWVLDFASHTEAGATEPLFAAAAVGLLFFGFRLFDGVTDPIAGVFSDAWTRRGRARQGLLWFSFALPPIGLALVFMPSQVMTPGMRWGLLAAGMFVFFVGYTFYAIPYWSLIDDYSGGDQARRARLSNILGASLLLATGIGFVASPPMVEAWGFSTAAIAIAIPCAVLMVLPVFARPKDATPPEPSSESAESGGSWHAIRAALTHRRFLAVVVLFAGGQMSFTVMTAAAPFIAVDLLGGTKGDVALLLGPFLVAAVPSFIFVPRMIARWGWERCTVTATVGLGLVYAGTGLLGDAILGTPITTAMILFTLGGPLAAVLLGLEGEAITASARDRPGENTAIYFGVYNFVVKGLNGVALYLTGLLAEEAREGAVVAVRIMGWTAGGLLVAGVFGYLAIRRRG